MTVLKNFLFNKLNWKQCFLLLLAVWIVINFFQAIFTEITEDEAYYFLYAHHLAWGYFDHPPMVALIIFVSKIFFAGNLSVRFVTLILQGFTLMVIWKIIADKLPDAKKVVLFFIISASLVMFEVYGFVAAPDVPLLFFTALFLLGYQQFLERESWRNALLLAVSIAGMMYSKYHAALVVGFIILSNLKLLTRYKFWIAALLAIALFAPHIYWQISNDYPSFKYHLSDRNSGFRWNYFFEYLPNQLAVFNPFTFGAVVYVLAKYRWKNIFEKGLYFLIIGFVIFFWVTSFRGHVEPHWTQVCAIPIIVLLYRRSMENKALMHYVKKWIALSLLLVLAARVLLISGWLPEDLGFNGKKAQSLAIESAAKNLPVVFTGSYQQASLYRFFTGKTAFVLSAIDSRQTQFDILKEELNYQGMPAFICVNDSARAKKYVVNGRTFYGYFAQHLQTVNRVNIEYSLPQAVVAGGGDTLRIPFVMHNPTNDSIDFRHAEFPVSCKAAYIDAQKDKPVYADCISDTGIYILPPRSSIHGHFSTIAPDLPAQEYQFTLTLVNPLCAAQNANFTSIKIIKK